MLRSLPLILAALGLALAACSGDDREPAPTGEAASTTPSAAANASPSNVLPPDLTRVIDVLLAGDLAGFNSLIEELPERCATSPSGVGSPPLCPPGVPDGGTINTFRYFACERGYPGEQQREVTERVLKRPRRLYAAFRPTPDSLFQVLPKGDVSLVFVSDGPNGELAERYEVRDGRIVGMWLACGPGLEPLRRMTEDARTFLLQPVFALPTPTPVPPTPAAGPGGYPLSRRTGLYLAPDIVLDAIESGQSERIQAHFQFYPVGCITMPVGIPSPPFCKPGQAAGTQVQVFPVLGCEGSFLERDAALTAASRLSNPALRIWAIFRQEPVAPSAFYDFPKGSMVIVLNQPGSAGIAIQVDGGLILSVWFGCGTTAADMLRGLPASAFVLSPPN